MRGLCRGCAPPVGLASPPAYTVPPVSRANPAGDVGLQGLRSPVGLAPPPAYTVPPVSRANPAGDVGLQGFRSPVGLAPPPAYSMSPVSRAKIEFMPVVARRRGYIEIFFSCDLLLILLHRLVAGVAVARKTGDIE